MFLDQEKRRCTVYESRPGVCRSYPESKHCGYYDFLRFERAHQADPDFIALT
jgi:Fe-S-cluster containining protein